MHLDQVAATIPCVIEDISDEEVPEQPERDREHIWHAANCVAAVLRDGGGVAVYCNGGRHRTRTVIAATPRLLDFSPQAGIESVEDALQKIGAGGWGAAQWPIDQIHDPFESPATPWANDII